jgi:lipoyl(octanoyl) transferase
MKFRLINSGYNTPAMNMAIDEALLTSKEPVLRFYQWEPAGLSIGYFQSAKEINLDNLKDIQLVRRLTGGNAVLHENELTYSFIIDEKEMPSSVIESYRIISQGLLEGLKLLGLNPTMNKVVEKQQKSAICFHDPSWYEILVDGKKIIGSAQKRTKGKVLQHGAILLDINTDKYASLFKKYNPKLALKLKQRITCINDIKPVSYVELQEAMQKGFSKHFELTNSELTVEELALAKELEKKYLSEEWNFKV